MCFLVKDYQVKSLPQLMVMNLPFYAYSPLPNLLFLKNELDELLSDVLLSSKYQPLPP